MAEFLAAIDYVLLNEGGFVNNPNDPGGATNFGIEQKEWPHGNVAAMTRDQAVAWYLSNYWNVAPYSQIVSQQIATKVFDTHVNMGLGTAVKIAQQALGFTGSAIDGDLGPGTIAAINKADESALLPELINRIQQHYKLLEELNPKLATFNAGWMARAARLPAPEAPLSASTTA